ncbi:Alpha beta hydrolase [Pyrenophora seminiperda CCB06]|uniref:Alpha beta hydrolase n=1 Tax=Pyrenophora seminiperda CCB06 TaxID=1302712 RepID=A0A3M7MB95_9PLEO|nr:Alpha beta hydrolase [Pyrenophora seminiperda CCB06]
MHKFFKNTWLDFEVIRILGTAPNGGAELCEVLEAVAAIKEGDAQSWHDAWKMQADRAEATAYRCLKDGNRELAKRAFLRASNYTRASQYMFIGAIPSQQDPRCLPIAEKGISLFRKGVELLDGGVRFLDIPYPGGIFLKAYLYLPHPSKRVSGKTPVLVNCGGADSIQEELYFLNPSAAPDLGYACLTFDGPGQGMALRREGLTLRPDWEHVTRHVLDYLAAYSKQNLELNLDLDRIAISGSALGGYFALRGATDARIKACVAMDPLYDMWDFGTQHVSPAFINAWMSGWLSKFVVDSIINVGASLNFQLKWEISVSGAFWKLDRPTDILLEMKKYTFRLPSGKNYLDAVSCPTLISGAANSLYLNVESHTMMVWRHLNGVSEMEKELWLANKPADGALQAKIGAFGLSNEYTFRFLDEKLGVKRGELFLDKTSL